jgi:hypothetical protein
MVYRTETEVEFSEAEEELSDKISDLLIEYEVDRKPTAEQIVNQLFSAISSQLHRACSLDYVHGASISKDGEYAEEPQMTTEEAKALATYLNARMCRWLSNDERERRNWKASGKLLAC